MQAKKHAVSHRIEIFLTNTVSLEKKLFDENFCNRIENKENCYKLKLKNNL